MITTETFFTENYLLNSLPHDELEKLSPDLKMVDLPRSKVIYSLNAQMDYVYFPEDAIVSVVTLFRDGSNLETGIVGREGIVGSSVCQKIEKSPREVIVQRGGRGLQLSTEKFQRAFEKNEMLHTLTLRYVFAYLEQVSQSGACSSRHSINERLARWLLMCHDRVDGDQINLTQEFIAQMLGVQRPGVTNAAMTLKNKGLIDYTRGAIKIKNREGLENASCECYETIRNVYDQYLSVTELRKLSLQLENAGNRMAFELQQKRRIEVETNKHLENLKNAVNNLNGDNKLTVFCADCKKIRDEKGEWHEVEDYLKETFGMKISHGICGDCKETLYPKRDKQQKSNVKDGEKQS